MRITVDLEAPDSPDALRLIRELDSELERQPYPQESRHAFSVEKLLREGVVFFVARMDGLPAGCGGVKLCDDYAEVKRMFVRADSRGAGIGRAVLDKLAAYSLEQQIRILRLETGIYQDAAIRLYERWGFERRGPFGEYSEDSNSVYFEKVLTRAH